MKLFLWKLSQDENNDYETYDSAVVVAADPVSASMVHPSRYSDIGDIKVVCLGEAASFLEDGDVVCSSFNAG